jgi:hypothetical protein
MQHSIRIPGIYHSPNLAHGIYTRNAWNAESMESMESSHLIPMTKYVLVQTPIIIFAVRPSVAYTSQPTASGHTVDSERPRTCFVNPDLFSFFTINTKKSNYHQKFVPQHCSRMNFDEV